MPVIRRRTPIRRGKPLPRKNAKRRKSEFARAYGSKERVEFVKSLPCCWCVARGRVRMCGPSENAHIETDGTGRKADYTKIAPLGRHHHEKYDRHQPPFNKPSTRLCVKIMARQTERLWSEWQTRTETEEMG